MSGYYGYDSSLSGQLQHHGVKGMHWGVRKNKGRTPTTPRHYDDHAKKLGAAEDHHAAIVDKHTARYRAQGMGRREAYRKALEHPEAKKAEAAMLKVDHEPKQHKEDVNALRAKLGAAEDHHGAIVDKHTARYRAQGHKRREAYRKALEHPESKAAEAKVNELDKKLRNR